MAKSILPNSDASILQPIQTEHGTFQVKLVQSLDDHALYFNDSILVIHNNGYSCHNLAKRIIEVWDGKRDKKYALDQYDYILACGGMGKARGSVEWIVSGCKEE